MIKRQVALALSLIAFLAVRADAREGFGFSKKAVDMTRTTPPGINIAGTRIGVIAASDRSGDADDAKTLGRHTEEAILEGDKRLSTAASPEITVRLMLNGLDANETWEQKSETKYQKTGTKQEWNSKKGKYETKDVYDNVEVKRNVKVVSGSVDGTYRITDADGRDLDSGSIARKFREKYDDGTGAPSTSVVRDDLLHMAARVVAGRIVPTHDRVNVIVPKGSFEALIPLAESGTWDRYLAGVEAVPENRRPDQEAYRQYALAIAKEAVAYATEDVVRATELLSESVGHYKKAIENNPNEKIFSEAHSSVFFKNAPAPLPRAEQDLAAYLAWKLGPTKAAASSHATSSQAPANPSRPSGTMRNETVIEMSRAGLSDDTIEMAIDSVAARQFDLSASGLVALAKSGVSNPVIAHMQKRAKK